MNLTPRQLGGLKAAEKNKAKDPDFYKKMGAKGGAKKSWELKSPKGFAANKTLARTAGQKGGLAKGENNKIMLERTGRNEG